LDAIMVHYYLGAWRRPRVDPRRSHRSFTLERSARTLYVELTRRAEARVSRPAWRSNRICAAASPAQTSGTLSGNAGAQLSDIDDWAVRIMAWHHCRAELDAGRACCGSRS